MIIDFHTHVLSPRIKNERSRYVDSDSSFALIYADPKAKIATSEDLIESMDRDGIDVSVIANYGWSTCQLCVETNDYILESIGRFPKRLIGFGALPSPLNDAAIAEVERCARGGMKGIGELRPDIHLPEFGQKDSMEPFVKTLREHGLILMTHSSEPVGHIYPGKGSVTPEKLYPFILNFPDIPIVCAHWGGGLPFYALMPEVKEALKNVYFDTAASPFLYKPQIYSQVSQLVGTDRILFGSDYPLMPASRLLGEMDSVNLDDNDKDSILAGNARRLLGI